MTARQTRKVIERRADVLPSLALLALAGIAIAGAVARWL